MYTNERRRKKIAFRCSLNFNLFNVYVLHVIAYCLLPFKRRDVVIVTYLLLSKASIIS